MRSVNRLAFRAMADKPLVPGKSPSIDELMQKLPEDERWLWTCAINAGARPSDAMTTVLMQRAVTRFMSATTRQFWMMFAVSAFVALMTGVITIETVAPCSSAALYEVLLMQWRHPW